MLVGSYICGVTQMGATVLLCNDNCDLLMVCKCKVTVSLYHCTRVVCEQPVAKLFSYVGWRKMEVLFTMAFVVSWIPMRLCLYFYKVLWSLMVDGYHPLKVHEHPTHQGVYIHVKHYSVFWGILVRLWIIYLLQFFWTKYLLEMIVTKLIKR